MAASPALAPLSLPSDPVAAPAGERYRILHVFRAPVGGLFRHVVDLTRLQAAAGHEVGIVCDSTTGGARAEQALEELGPCLSLGVRRVPMLRNPHPGDLRALLAVRAAAEAVEAEVLHGHGAKGGVYARLAPVRTGGRALIRAYTPHGGSYNYKPGTLAHRIYMGAEGVLSGRTDVHLFESEYVAGRHFAYVFGKPQLTRIVHNGISEAEFEPIVPAAERFDLVYIGELREAKGLPWLLEAIADLRRKGRSVTLLMVGSGPDADAIAAAAERLGLRDAITFEPPQAIRPVLARGRVMVVPSLAESLPYVVLEAAAARQPLVATDVGGIPEIFAGRSSDLVPPRDARALSDAIAQVLDEPEEVLQRRVESLGASVQARFSMNRMSADVLSGYAAAFRNRTEADAARHAKAVARESA